MALQRLFQVRCDGQNGAGRPCGDMGAIVVNAAQARQVRYSSGIRRVLIGRYALNRRDGSRAATRPEYADLCPMHRDPAALAAHRARTDQSWARYGYERVD